MSNTTEEPYIQKNTLFTYKKQIQTILILFVLCFSTFPNTPKAQAQDVVNQEIILTERITETVAPLSANITIKEVRTPALETIKYTVSSGDSLSKIANKYKDLGVTVESLQWSNNITDSLIFTGNVLEISPGPGLIHKAGKDENLKDIARKYKKINDQTSEEDVQKALKEIADINALSQKSDSNEYIVEEGKKLIIPGGSIPEKPKAQVQVTVQPKPEIKEVKETPQKQIAKKEVKKTHPAVGSPKPEKTEGIASKEDSNSCAMGWPVRDGYLNGQVSQGIYPGHNGLDLWSKQKDPKLVAVAHGVVDYVGDEKGGGGKVVRITFDNGIKAKYAHTVGDFKVKKDDRVVPGQELATMGRTGIATGVHLHIELYSKEKKLLDPQVCLRRPQ